MKTLVCKICTIKLVEAAYGHAWWFRLLREPLRLGMLAMGKLYGVDIAVYAVRDAACRGCPRMVKLELKERSALFRLLNTLINRHFDRLIERLLTGPERLEAEEFAEKAVHGEITKKGLMT